MLRVLLMVQNINLKSGMSLLEAVNSIKNGLIFLMENFFGANVLTDGVSMYTLSSCEYVTIKKLME